MAHKILTQVFDGLIVFQSDLYSDNRGTFLENWRQDIGDDSLPKTFVQDNLSYSNAGVIRGLHFQWDKPQGKYIRVLNGSATFVEVDIRKNSPNFGKYFQIELNSNNGMALWVPPGFANGFLANADNTIVYYKCTALWNPNAEAGLRWNDPKININWGIENPILSLKDADAPTLDEWAQKPESEFFSL